MAGGTGGGGQPGQIQGSDIANAMFGTQMSDIAMQNRYQQLGLGGQGATPSGPTTGKTKGIPGSGTTPVTPGQFATGPAVPPTTGAPSTPSVFKSPFGTIPGSATGGTPGSPGNIPGTPAGTSPPLPTGGPTAFEMDIGALPSWTGGIPQQFQAALGEGQFQDLSATTSAAVGAQQAKGQVAQGIGGLIGGI